MHQMQDFGAEINIDLPGRGPQGSETDKEQQGVCPVAHSPALDLKLLTKRCISLSHPLPHPYLLLFEMYFKPDGKKNSKNQRFKTLPSVSFYLDIPSCQVPYPVCLF